MDVFAVKSKKISKKINSSSGGVWIELAEYYLNEGWYVYGVVFEDTKVLFQRFGPEDSAKIHRTQGSKYVQALMGDIIKQIRHDLETGKNVLFCGTPCQVAAVVKIASMINLKGRLITVDIICHGVPSPKVFADYCNLKEKLYNGKIEKFLFRDKVSGSWSECKETFEINKRLYEADDWAKLFYQHEIMRPSCYKCRFTNLNRPSDITLGDFWGIEHYDADFYDETGVSLVLINTEQGRKLLDGLRESLDIMKADIRWARQPQLYKPVRKPILRGLIWKIYYKSGVEGVISCMNNRGLYTFLDNTIKMVKKLIKHILKGIKMM